MDSINNALQPFLNIMNLLNIFMLIVFLGIGVQAAFFFKNFIYALLLPITLIAFASAFSQLLPGLATGMTNYIWALVIGFISGKVVKLIGQYLLGYKV